MKHTYSGLSIIFFILFIFPTSVSNAQDRVISNFKQIKEQPRVIEYFNNLPVNNRGGHIQGIQAIENNTGSYFVLSGSSDSYSYYTIVKQGFKNEVISVNKLMDKPFKHAGGFQVYQNYMAVGIEDNDRKDKSKVCIYDISNLENPSAEPIAIIEREGKPLRSTAGCVGMTKYNEKILLAVGDWDTKNIDFYSCKSSEFPKADFELFFSINTETISKENWIDDKWLSYQNINLFKFSNNELMLVGLGQNTNNENVADLFSLNENIPGKFDLIKIASKTFQCTDCCNFKAAAGVALNENGEISIISACYNIENASVLNYFEISKN